MLQEAEEFAAEYAPIKRKTARPAAAATDEALRKEVQKLEVSYFSSATKEFAGAMRKIPPELLRLLKDQFQASPSVLISGIFGEEKPAATESLEIDEVFEFSEEEISDD